MARRLMTVLMGALLLLEITAGSVLAAPDNDSALTPTAIGSLPFSDTLDTTTATADDADPSGCGSLTNTVWYSLATGSTGIGHLILDTSGTDYAAVIYVSAGSPDGAFVSCTNGSSIAFDAAPSTTYYIVIGDLGGAGGTLVFSATQGLAFSGTVSRVGSVNAKTGVVTVRGTYSCNRPSTVVAIEVSLSQAVGRFIISGTGANSSLNGACDPSTTYPWAIEVFGTNGKFAGGKATATVTIVGNDASGDSWYANLGPFQLTLKK